MSSKVFFSVQPLKVLKNSGNPSKSPETTSLQYSPGATRAEHELGVTLPSPQAVGPKDLTAKTSFVLSRQET